MAPNSSMAALQSVAGQQAPPPPGPPGSSLDVLNQVAQGKVKAPSDTIGTWDKLGAGISAAGEANPGGLLPPGGGQIVSGALKGLAETAHGIGKFLGMTGEEPEALKPQGGLEHIGSAMETVAEFASGDEALKGLAVADKLKMMSGVAEAMQKYPILSRIIVTGVRTGVVSGVQQTAKTGDIKQGLEGAAIGAVAGPIAEETGGLVQKGVKSLEKSAGSEGRIAELGNKVLQKYAGKLGGQAEAATSLGDASDKIKDLAQKEVYKVMDEASQGEFSTLQQTIKKSADIAKRTGSYSEQIEAEARIGEAENRIGKLIDMTDGKVTPEIFQAARAGWKDASTLGKIDRAVDAAFNEPEDVKNLMGDKGRIMKADVGKRLNTMLNRVPVAEIDRALGPGGAKNLFTIARENSSPIIDALSQDSYFSKTAKSAQDARRLAVKFLISNPKAGKLFSDASRIGASAKVVVPAILGATKEVQPETQQ